jgi:hypothetical protein
MNAPGILEWFGWQPWHLLLGMMLGMIALWCGLVGGRLGRERGEGSGFVYGLCFGPLGIIIMLLLPMTPEAEARHQAQVAIQLKRIQAAERTACT